MKTPVGSTSGLGTRRRKLLQAAAAGAALGVLPASNVLAAAVLSLKNGPTVAMGYVPPNSDGSLNASSASSIVDALSVGAVPANYQLRVLGVSTEIPLGLVALYPHNAEHYFWQAWTEQGMLQNSSPITIRWWANTRSPLPLVVQMGKTTATTQVTARTGTYALAIGPNAQALPAWKTLALRDGLLVSQSTGAEVSFPYALFAVSMIA